MLRGYYTLPECGDCHTVDLYRRVASRTIVELPQPWGYVGGVIDMNDSGVVVGYLSNDWDYLPVRWDATNQPQLIPLPPGFQPEAWPTAVNRHGQVVGQGTVDEGRFTFHAWTTLGDVAIDLAQDVPLEGGDWLSAASDVNRHGVILATSEAGASYRLVPQAPAMATVSGGVTRTAAGESDGVGGEYRSDR